MADYIKVVGAEVVGSCVVPEGSTLAECVDDSDNWISTSGLPDGVCCGWTYNAETEVYSEPTGMDITPAPAEEPAPE